MTEVSRLFLFICDLFNGAVSSSGFVESSGRMISLQ
jgi:hypothetical protein